MNVVRTLTNLNTEQLQEVPSLCKISGAYPNLCSYVVVTLIIWSSISDKTQIFCVTYCEGLRGRVLSRNRSNAALHHYSSLECRLECWNSSPLVVNPRRACAARVTVVVLSFCLSVCLSVCPREFSHYRLQGGQWVAPTGCEQREDRY